MCEFEILAFERNDLKKTDSEQELCLPGRTNTTYNQKPKHQPTHMNLFLFHGSDNYQTLKKIKFWQEQFISKHGEEGIEVIDHKEFDLGNFATNLTSMPFLSEKRLIIVKNLLTNSKKEDFKELLTAIKNIPDFSILVFYEDTKIEKANSIHKYIAKSGKVEEFNTLSPELASKYIVDEGKKRGLTLKFEHAHYLSQHIRTDQWTINNELQKLSSYLAGAPVTKEAIDMLIPLNITSSVFKLTDAIAIKNTKRSLEVFEILKESGEDLIKIFFIIVRQFRILLQVKDLQQNNLTQREITLKLKEHPFVIQKSYDQCKNFPMPKLKAIYEKFLDIDRKTKTGIIRFTAADNRALKLAIEQLIMDCCKA